MRGLGQASRRDWHADATPYALSEINQVLQSRRHYSHAQGKRLPASGRAVARRPRSLGPPRGSGAAAAGAVSSWLSIAVDGDPLILTCADTPDCRRPLGNHGKSRGPEGLCEGSNKRDCLVHHWAIASDDCTLGEVLMSRGGCQPRWASISPSTCTALNCWWAAIVDHRRHTRSTIGCVANIASSAKHRRQRFIGTLLRARCDQPTASEAADNCDDRPRR